MNRSLTPEQINKLFAFCEKQEIYDYDVQIEIVDHLASSIEHQWKKEPELPFGWALKNIREKFGWRRFRKLESKLSRQLKHKFHRVLWNFFLEYFKFPKVVITLTITLVLFSLLQLFDKNMWVIIAYFIPLSAFSLYYIFIYFPKKIEITTVQGKSFMILDYLKTFSKNTAAFIYFPYWLTIFGTATLKLNHTNALAIELAISILLASFTVLMYGYFIYLPQKIRGYFMSNYGEFAQ